jgi:GST-like protein
MIDFYTFQTSNGQRVGVMLEECALPYRVHWIDLMKGEQRSPDYLALNPAGAIPTIVDPDGPGGKPIVLTQSGAILLYLAQKSGRFLPADPVRRALAWQWLMFAVTDCMGATAGIFFETALLPAKSEQNRKWYEDRMVRFFRVADGRLAQHEWLADELSIADFALYTIYALRKPLADAAGDLANLERWGRALAARPAVQKALRPPQL